MRETYQILLTSNYDTSLLLFCDGAYSLTVEAIADVHVRATNAEIDVTRVGVVVVVVRRRTPIAAVVTIIVEQCTVTVARSRKENIAAVGSYNL